MVLTRRQVLSATVIATGAALVASVPSLAETPATAPAKTLPVPGEQFAVEGHGAFLIAPTNPAGKSDLPWVWYAPTLRPYPGPEEKWLIQQFLNAGIAVAGIDVGESYGSPHGRKLFTALHHELTANRGYSGKPALLARSRGGLMHYNWAAENTDKVACVAGIYPVCDLRSYPGLAKACGAFEMTAEQLAAALPQHNPINRLEPLAKAAIPLLHLHGDSDKLVPLEQNSAELARRYEKLGGPMTLRVFPGHGHDMWDGWFKNPELVEFITRRVLNKGN